MKKIFQIPEINAFEFSLEDAIMTSAGAGFAENGSDVPTYKVEDPAADSSDWG